MVKANTAMQSKDGPNLERSIGLTDAVVAIAMTLLVLPLVEAAGQVDTDRMVDFVVERFDLFLSFVVGFLVIYLFWSAHGTALRRVVGTGADVPGLRPLNMLWMLTIAFLPFPTAIVGREFTTTSAPLWFGSMLVLSALTSGIVAVISRATGPTPRTRLAWLTTAVFAVCTLLSAVNAGLGRAALLLLLVALVIEGRVSRRSAAGR